MQRVLDPVSGRHVVPTDNTYRERIKPVDPEVIYVRRSPSPPARTVYVQELPEPEPIRYQTHRYVDPEPIYIQDPHIQRVVQTPVVVQSLPATSYIEKPPSYHSESPSYSTAHVEKHAHAQSTRVDYEIDGTLDQKYHRNNRNQRVSDLKDNNITVCFPILLYFSIVLQKFM